MTWRGASPRVRVLAALLALVAAFAYPLRAPAGALAAGPHVSNSAEHHAPPPHPAAHLAHCLFCLTGAFALTPDPGPLLAGTAQRVPRTGAPAPRAAHAPPLLTRARAPPLPARL